MAEELTIKLKTELEGAKKDIKSLQDRGATKNIPNADRDFKELTNSLEKLTKVTDPTNQQLREIYSTFKQLNNLIKTVSDTVRTITPEAKKIDNEIVKTTSALDKAQEKLSNLRKKGNDSGTLRKSYVEDQIKGITYKSGAHAGKQVSVASFTKNAASDKQDFSIYNDPNKAKTVWANLQKTQTNLPKEYEQAYEAVKQLETQLQELNEKAKQLSQSGDDLIHANATERTGTVQAIIGNEKAQREAEESAKDTSVDVNENSLKKQTTSLGKAFRAFSIYNIAVKTTQQALRSATKTIQDLDKYLTEQAMVTGKTRKETYALLSSYQDLAAETGATTKEIAGVATEFMRQGKTAKESLTLTEAAVKAAKVSGISVSESIDYLTTALNGFQLSADMAMDVSDKFAAVAATSATDYEELAIALSKVASQANLAGMSIDYTTALLAKGIETTREAPETIGTALKTIIARMRELSDYGETLEDGTDINNVETQLGYVGIALRTQTGELRSTEDVLDELGKKWDTLNSNQQAAVAKALAGTRQQSRLIAMMSDYERVTELQEVAQRSAGATASQANAYMEGMAAALNRISVGWEKIVSAFTDSDVIINLVNIVGNVLDNLSSFLNTTGGMIGTMTVLSAIGLVILGNKIKEMTLAKMQQKYNAEQAIYDNKESKKQQEINIQKAKGVVLEKQQTIEATKKHLRDLEDLKVLKAKNGESTTEIDAQIAQAQKDLATQQAELANAESVLSLETQKGQILNAQTSSLESQTSLMSKLSSGVGGLIAPLMTMWGIYKGLVVTFDKIIYRQKIQAAQQDKNNIKSQTGAAFSMASSAATNGPAGWVIAAAILAAFGVGIALAVTALASSSSSAEESAADEVNKLSSEIYKLTEKASGLKNITDQYNELDNAIIRTKEDQKEMNELLDSASDKLSSENEKDSKGNEIDGTSEKDIYENLTTDAAKASYLEKVTAEATEEANEARQEQLQLLKNLTKAQRDLILTSQDSSDYLQTQDAVFAINNNTLYEYIDSLGDAKDGVEEFAQSILESMDAATAYELAIDGSHSTIQSLVDTLNGLTKTMTDADGKTAIVSLSEILTSDDYNFNEKMDAFEELRETIQAMGDTDVFDAFTTAYQQWFDLAERINETAQEFINKMDFAVEEINTFGTALQDLGYDSTEATGKINELFTCLQNGASITSSIDSVFADLKATMSDDEWTVAYTQILNAYQVLAGQGALNIGQNITSLKNQINSFYEKAAEWSELTDQEKTEFIQDNYKLFEGEEGRKLYEAFETGNYNTIQEALGNNENLRETVRLRLQELQTDLAIEEARRETGDADEAYIKYLQKEIEALEDYEDVTSELYQASLELRLEQEEAQLDLYKEYLEKQQDALEESLEDRKDAYQDYFDTVNQESEDEDYEEQASLLQANLTKLASSTNATAKEQSKELEQQLEDLEEERLQTLRERAQEQVIQNLEDEVDQISEKFDTLLDDSAQMLSLMKGELNNPESFITEMLTSGVEGMTATQAEDYIKNNFSTAFDSELPSGALDNINVEQRGENLYLTVNGQEIQIGDAAEKDLYSTIMKAMKQLGLK